MSAMTRGYKLLPCLYRQRQVALPNVPSDTDGWTNGRTDKRTDGQTNGWTHGRTAQLKVFKLTVKHYTAMPAEVMMGGGELIDRRLSSDCDRCTVKQSSRHLAAVI